MYQSSNGMWRLCAISPQVLKSELQRQGVTVNNHVCEFPYSRQEIYHLVRVNQIKHLMI